MIRLYHTSNTASIIEQAVHGMELPGASYRCASDKASEVLVVSLRMNEFQ